MARVNSNVECTQLPSVGGTLYYCKRALRVVLCESESISVTSAGCKMAYTLAV